jgi:hypothetical protein
MFNPMTTIYVTAIIVGLLYGIPAAVRTFRSEMADDENVWLVVTCIYIMVFYSVTQVWFRAYDARCRHFVVGAP